jgi:hypothetical protein
VRVLLQGLSPRMQHGEDADFGAEVFRIGGNFRQGCGRGREQKAVQELLVL